jgi:hypothetical protein
MGEYIEREAVKEAAWEGFINNLAEDQGMYGYLAGLVNKVFDAIPTADVVPVRHGRWIEQPRDFDLCGVAYYQCSECGKEQQASSNYCQFCGARMDKDGDGDV